jgi:DNA modification methylase
VDSRDLSGAGWSVLFGSCLDRLPELADNSVDAVVCDPPYELGFMGKSWDSSGIAFNSAVWAECLRVLKPGGHILAFGGSRTWHRIAVAVEDAGFEIRDSIAWLYGSGFPKSLDVSKAIDKRGGKGAGLAKEIGQALKEAREKRNVSKSQADEMFCDGTTNWTWFEGRPAGQRPPTPETFARIVAEWQELKPLAEIVAEAEREVIGQKTSGIANKEEGARHTIGASKAVEVDVTAPNTAEAVKWQGWGTALKPAFEPVIVGRKPLVGTVAANVLEWGTGGLNIDGTRITGEPWKRPAQTGVPFDGNWKSIESESNAAGRWPSNVMLDEVTAGLVDEQSGVSASKATVGNRTPKDAGILGTFTGQQDVQMGHSDSGGASRFFYIAKTSKRDRNEGLNLCRCDKLTSWENEGHEATHLADTETSAQKATAASGTPNNNGSGWNTSLSGSDTTDQSPKSTKSTTLTETNLTTTSATSLPLTPSHTKGFIPAVNSETASGGNLAKVADRQNPLTITTGISAEKGGLSMEDADPATLESSLSQSKLGAHQCAKCGGIVGGHPTVKPTDLMRQLVRLVTPPCGVVLDPFTGSGSTGKAAILEGFQFIGCELTEDYLPIIQGRIDWAVAEVARLADMEEEKLF